MLNFFIAFITATLALTVALVYFRARKVLRKAGSREAALRKLNREQSVAIRVMARETLRLRRLYKELSLDAIVLNDERESLCGQIKEAEKIDRRVYVLDDRCTAADAAWLAVTVHPNYKVHISPKASTEQCISWAKGRRYVVWAINKERALDTVSYTHLTLPTNREV